VSSLRREVWPSRLEALFFGDFLLGQQKKVTRPPGRIPGAAPLKAKNTQRQGTYRTTRLRKLRKNALAALRPS